RRYARELAALALAGPGQGGPVRAHERVWREGAGCAGGQVVRGYDADDEHVHRYRRRDLVAGESRSQAAGCGDEGQVDTDGSGGRPEYKRHGLAVGETQLGRDV